MAVNLFNDLQHKVVLVTGSSSGIGEAIVTLFSQLGAHVVVTGRNEQRVSDVALKCEQLSTFKYKPLTFVGDLMKDENIKQLVEQTLEKHSKIDILVNNAAMDMATISCSFMDAGFLNKYDNALRLELDVPIKICRLTMPYLIESKGSIINVSSVAAKRPVNEGMLHSVCKAAIEAMTKCLALEFGPKGVRVNTVNPGFVRTPQTEPYLEDPHSLKQAKSYSVFHQVGEAEEIAFAVAFLASNASNFVTGTNLLVDGGFLLK